MNAAHKKDQAKHRATVKRDAKRMHEKEINALIEDVYEILGRQDKKWEPSDEELYSLLERVIFLKARENTFRDFFDNMENAIEAASQLDFSKRAPISEITLDKRNLFNYAVMCLNILVEKMESSVVSMKAVNTMLSALPGTMMVVTNNKGVIRFMNDTGEKLLGLEKNEYLGKSISLLLADYEQIHKEHSETGITDRLVHLVTPGNKKNRIPVYLTIPAPYTDHTEVEEIVYTLSVDNKLLHHGEKGFNLTQTFHNAILPLNTIIETADLLSEKIIDKDGKVLMDNIQSNISKLQANVKNTLHAISTGTIHFSERTPINIAHFVSEIIKSLKFNTQFDPIQFDVDIDYNNELHADPILIYSLFKNVITLAISENYKSTVIQISVWDLNKSELLIRINDNGIAKPAKEKLKLAGPGAPTDPVKDKDLYKVKEIIQQLKGSIDIYSNHGHGCTYTLRIPCVEKQV